MIDSRRMRASSTESRKRGLADAPDGASAKWEGRTGRGDLAADAEGEVDRYARRAFRVDGQHVERELAGVDVLERERRDEGAGGRWGDRRLAHDLVLLVEELDRHRRRLVDAEGERQGTLATEVTEVQFGLEVATDDRLVEAGNAFEGKRVAGPGGVLKRPSSWPLFRNPLRPSWGEPYQQIAQRMLAAALKARDEAAGHEAVCVSHQLPIVCLRRYVEDRRLWHDPRKRQCSLASITSLVFEDEHVVKVDYAEPAGTTPNVLSKQPPGA